MISPYLASLRAMVGSRPLLMPSASAVVFDGDLVLAGFHTIGRSWLVPGGAIDPGETPAEAAVRETKEETGLDIVVDRLIGVWGGTPDHHIVYPNGDVVDYVMATFGGRVVGGDLRPDPEEFEELRWFRLDELRAMDVAPWMDDVLDAIDDPSKSFHRPG